MNRQGGRFEIPQRYVYIAAAIGLLVGVYLVYQLLTAGLQSYLAVIAGVMLLIGNAPELVRSLQRREIGLAMLNTLVGAALVSFFLGSILAKIVFWPLAIVLLALALPLTINRAGIAGAYLRGLRQLFGQARHLMRMRSRSI
ncbi:MAG TPA: hypothetical protein VEZ12_20070 [Herpetosiphonaceae bacterium]|nr:hypothetical protein [Herpetosiphonaceae bacterium]